MAPDLEKTLCFVLSSIGASNCPMHLKNRILFHVQLSSFIAGQMNLDMIMEAEKMLKEVIKEAKGSPEAASTNDECQDFINNIKKGKSTMCKKI